MKKLMILLAVAALATVGNAAAIKWNSGTIYNQSGSKANAGTALVSASLYMLTSEQYATVSAMAASDVYKAAESGTYGTAAFSQNSTALGAININQTGLTGGTSTSPASYYGVIVYKDTISSASDSSVDAYVKVVAKQVTFQDDGTVTLAGLATNVSTWSAVSASSVPEPTSSLLLLLGMAGLALKRKRA